MAISNNHPDGRIIAIGDIHGCSFALESLLDVIRPTLHDQIVCLGDVVDCGRETRNVLDTLLNLREQCQLTMILGNHEEMLLNAFDDSGLLSTWLNLGGYDTINSYRYAGTIADIPSDHIAFIREFRDFFETEGHIFTHANYDPELPLAEMPGHVLRWSLLEEPFPTPHRSGKVAIVGHTEQHNGEILDLEHVKCIDTCCHGYGWLTALDVNSGNYWQTSRWGAFREGETIDGLHQARSVLHS
ncbi:MAG: metallophosphoesterase [Pirellulaceae bacterium]|nr:metallophosphoesterase [Pirellulaceae bacterium]